LLLDPRPVPGAARLHRLALICGGPPLSLLLRPPCWGACSPSPCLLVSLSSGLPCPHAPLPPFGPPRRSALGARPSMPPAALGAPISFALHAGVRAPPLLVSLSPSLRPPVSPFPRFPDSPFPPAPPRRPALGARCFPRLSPFPCAARFGLTCFNALGHGHMTLLTSLIRRAWVIPGPSRSRLKILSASDCFGSIPPFLPDRPRISGWSADGTRHEPGTD
jgi:hypothetical protein